MTADWFHCSEKGGVRREECAACFARDRRLQQRFVSRAVCATAHRTAVSIARHTASAAVGFGEETGSWVADRDTEKVA